MYNSGSHNDLRLGTETALRRCTLVMAIITVAEEDTHARICFRLAGVPGARRAARGRCPASGPQQPVLPPRAAKRPVSDRGRASVDPPRLPAGDRRVPAETAAGAPVWGGRGVIDT